MTLMPVSKISTDGFSSRKAGGSRWIDQRSTPATAGFSSTGSPITFQIRPSVESPTGTEIGAPVSTTSAPRASPSVESIATARTRSSPRCCCTSATSVEVEPSGRAISISTAWRIWGRRSGKTASITTPLISMIWPVLTVLAGHGSPERLFVSAWDGVRGRRRESAQHRTRPVREPAGQRNAPVRRSLSPSATRASWSRRQQWTVTWFASSANLRSPGLRSLHELRARGCDRRDAAVVAELPGGRSWSRVGSRVDRCRVDRDHDAARRRGAATLEDAPAASRSVTRAAADGHQRRAAAAVSATSGAAARGDAACRLGREPERSVLLERRRTQLGRESLRRTWRTQLHDGQRSRCASSSRCSELGQLVGRERRQEPRTLARGRPMDVISDLRR